MPSPACRSGRGRRLRPRPTAPRPAQPSCSCPWSSQRPGPGGGNHPRLQGQGQGQTLPNVKQTIFNSPRPGGRRQGREGQGRSAAGRLHWGGACAAGPPGLALLSPWLFCMRPSGQLGIMSPKAMYFRDLGDGCRWPPSACPPASPQLPAASQQLCLGGALSSVPWTARASLCLPLPPSPAENWGLPLLSAPSIPERVSGFLPSRAFTGSLRFCMNPSYAARPPTLWCCQPQSPRVG